MLHLLWYPWFHTLHTNVTCFNPSLWMNSLPYLIEGVKIVKTEESQSITENSPNKKKEKEKKKAQ